MTDSLDLDSTQRGGSGHKDDVPPCAMPSNVLGLYAGVQCLQDSKPQTGLACLDSLAESTARLLRDYRDIIPPIQGITA